MAERFTIERRHTGLALYDQEAFLAWVCDDEAIALRDLLNREFPDQGSSAPETTNAQQRERYVGTSVSIPEIDEFNAETWRLDEEAAHARRRERVATAVLPGLMALHGCEEDTYQEYAEKALMMADALIAALDEPRP